MLLCPGLGLFGNNGGSLQSARHGGDCEGWLWIFVAAVISLC